MSWYKNKFNPNDKDMGIDFGGTHNNQGLAKLAIQKEQFYKQYIEKYASIKLSNRFIYE